MRLTVAQATIRFLTNQYVERDGSPHRFFAGCFGIFGHGNVAGLGRALLDAGDEFQYYMARNEQAMVHAAVAYARVANRLGAFACTTSVGPGATNLVTGAAVATINRLPVLLLPSDVFATRRANPVLQELEDSRSMDVSVNDCLRPVSRYFDRVWRPEQLPAALMHAMQVLTSPSETGAATIALPEDVQTEAWDWPDDLFSQRVWHVPRQRPESQLVSTVALALRSSRRPLVVAGGGVIYSEATDALAALATRTGLPVAETQAGKGSLRFDHPSSLGGIGVTGSSAANDVARRADVVLGIGTRWTDFTTASHSLFEDPRVSFVNVNVAPLDSHKLSGLAVLGDARITIEALSEELSDWHVDASYGREYRALADQWASTVDLAFGRGNSPLPSQPEVIGALQAATEDRDVVVCAAGSMPGDLHKLWRARDPKGYHVEYGFSCMGYEIAGGLGAKLAARDREVYVLVGDSSYLMMNSELVTAIQEGLKLIVIVVDNHGYQSIGALSESVGSERFGTRNASRGVSGHLDGPVVHIDFVANAASLGAVATEARTIEEFVRALREARANDCTTVIRIETDPSVPAPDSGAWWDVPIAEVVTSPSVDAALGAYQKARLAQRSYLRPPDFGDGTG